MEVLFRLENLFREFQVRICTQKRINDHMLYGGGYQFTNFDEIMVIANLKRQGTHSFYGYRLTYGVCTELDRSRKYDSRP